MNMSKSKMSTTSIVVVALGIIGIIVVTTITTESRAVMQTIRGGYGSPGLSALNSTSPQISSTNMNPVATPLPTILELVGSTEGYECPEGLVLVEDNIDPSFYEKPEGKIPKVVHMTSKSRCMTQAFADNVDKWRFQGFSLFLHDDDALDRLIYRQWPEFPQLQDTLKCMVPGAAFADLWRYMMIWSFGGIYTDIDNGPGPWLWNETGSVITDETDALFEQERDGFPSQYFFAASPHHPVMFLAVYQTMHRVMDIDSVRRQYVPFVTGPGAIKKAFINFAGGEGYPSAGIYPGSMTKDRSVTIIGDPVQAKNGHFVIRDARSVKKVEGFEAMNLTHWSKVNTTEKPDHWCTTVLADIQEEKQMDNFKRHFRV